MNGQWTGTYTGTNDGEIVINIDDVGSHFHGIAYLNECDPAFPRTAAEFRTENKNADFAFRTILLAPIDPHAHDVSTWDIVKKFYQDGIVFPKYADVTGQWSERSLKMTWQTDIG